jgi:hypothetical protein
MAAIAGGRNNNSIRVGRTCIAVICQGVLMALRAAEIDEDGGLPARNRGVRMARRAAELDEDVRLPAPNRDRNGVYMALRAAETDEDALSDERGINNLGRVFNGAGVFTGVFNGVPYGPAGHPR